MRAIEIRVWNPFKKVMEYGVEEINVSGSDVIAGIENGCIVASYMGEGNQWKKAPTMQYIGTSDKRGTKIYEGDITQSKHGQIGVVIWDEYQYVVRWAANNSLKEAYDSTMSVGKLGTVVGNIYEHPHFLPI